MAAPTIPGSFQIFSFRGIRVLVHWTFLLLLGWVLMSGLMDGEDLRGVWHRIVLLLIVFVCVLLHEFGHALTALRLGIRTRDITLLPIGGLASLERMPEEPRKEFLITIAGPLVNLAIVILIGLVLGVRMITTAFTEPFGQGGEWTDIGLFVLTANLYLFLFNLIPAFPMDGGRILRSVLAVWLSRERATRIAAGVGRVFAIGFIVAAFTWREPMLAIIGLFVFLAAGAETRQVRSQSLLRGLRVRHVMRTRFWSLPSDVTVRQAVDELLAGGDRDLVVMARGEYQGVLRRREMIEALRDQGQDRPLSTLTLTKAPAVAPDDDADKAFSQMVTGRWPLMPVMENGVVIGVLESENLTEFLMMRQARNAPATGAHEVPND